MTRISILTSSPRSLLDVGDISDIQLVPSGFRRGGGLFIFAPSSLVLAPQHPSKKMPNKDMVLELTPSAFGGKVGNQRGE